ncbi:hypothetical protein FE257_010728 [Aspergillus nanangensis]|uniref:Succinate-semialdehyde dehydrogenase, mitochondrial n=1 Tax=Aspergillus nanangensis TaxID=2582783 RepID=A0AAD4CVD6_ASPNN|nr:hypothetical protein FE257_010728 [Aspergillus nanangensis]
MRSVLKAILGAEGVAAPTLSQKRLHFYHYHRAKFFREHTRTMTIEATMTSPLKKAIPYQFNDPSLIDTRSFINGVWTGAASGKTFTLSDPTDNTEICQIADLSTTDTQQAIAAAHAAFQTYQHTPHRERRFLMRRWGDQIKAHRDDLAALCTLELGKPFTDSLGTVQYAIDFVDWFEGAIERTLGETIPAARGNNRVLTIRQPQGVVAAITPWNSPVAMVTRKVGAAIAAGNTVVCKPAPETPLCAIALAKLWERAGGPKGVFNVVTSGWENTPLVGGEMCKNMMVKHLSFTGSTAVGRVLNTECARTIKKTSLELGGNASFIVFEDADLEKAVAGLITSKFRSSGQTCVCANRIYVHSSIIDKFADALAQGLKKTFVYGSVWDRNVNFGPLYSGKAIAKVESHLGDALEKGATVHYGGKDSSLGPNFFPATVVKGGKRDMAFMTEETFGPLAFLVPFDSEEEVVREANNARVGDAEVGLASYFYTEDLSRAFRITSTRLPGLASLKLPSNLHIQAFKRTYGVSVHSRGIFHGLPTYADNIKGLTAMVTGANGISGTNLIKVLRDAPERWTKIYCVSRSPPPECQDEKNSDGRIEHLEMDFLQDPVQLASILRQRVKHVDHIFFFSFVLPPQNPSQVLSLYSNATEIKDINTTLLSNFLLALRQTPHLTPKRLLLQTGAKHYGFHLGPILTPSFESDPRIPLEDNFYYPQEDLLFEYCRSTGAEWNVVRPAFIIGAAPTNARNYLIAIAIYAAVQTYLRQPLAFPGDYHAWDREYCQSSALLNGYFEEWVVLEARAGNQALNVQDGLAFSWGRMWPQVAAWYGGEWCPPEGEGGRYRLVEARGKGTPRGYGPPGVSACSFSLVEWSQRKDVEEAWSVLSEKYQLKYDLAANRSVSFGMADLAIIGEWPLALSMRKARKLGWHGCVDSYESSFKAISDLAREGIVPPMVLSSFPE